MWAVGGVDGVKTYGASGRRREDEDVGIIVEPDDVWRRKPVSYTSERNSLVLKNGVVSSACLVQTQFWLHYIGGESYNGHCMGGESYNGHCMGGESYNGHCMGGESYNGHCMGGESYNGHCMGGESYNGHCMGGESYNGSTAWEERVIMATAWEERVIMAPLHGRREL